MQVLHSHNYISFQLEKMGRVLTEKFKKEEEITFVCDLHSVNFATDLIKQYKGLCKFEILIPDYKISQITNLTQSKVVLLETMVNTGKSLKLLKSQFETVGIDDLTVVSLIVRGEDNLQLVNHTCLKILGSEFLVGYGLSKNGYFGNLPDLCIYNANR